MVAGTLPQRVVKVDEYNTIVGVDMVNVGQCKSVNGAETGV